MLVVFWGLDNVEYGNIFIKNIKDSFEYEANYINGKKHGYEAYK